MGDIVDFMFQSGQMDFPDPFNHDDNEDAGYYYSKTKYNKVCRRCLRGGLHWRHTDDGWRLFEHNSTMHACSSIVT